MSTIPTNTYSHASHGVQTRAVVASSPAEQAYNAAVDFFSQQLGLNAEAMTGFYNKFISNSEAYKQLGLYIGVDPDELGAEAKKRYSGANTEYISQRVAMLKQIGGAMASSPTLNHLHNFFTYSQRSFEAAGGSVDELSPYLKEAHEAAKKAVKDIPEFAARLQSDVKAFIYDPEIRRLTSEELGRRHAELTKIDEIGLKYSHRGWHGRLADFGIVGGLTIGTFTQITGYLGRLGFNKGEGKHYSRTQLGMKSGFWNRLFNGGSRDVSMARALGINEANVRKLLNRDTIFACGDDVMDGASLEKLRNLFCYGGAGKKKPVEMVIGNVTQKYTSYETLYTDLLKQANASKIADLKKGIAGTKLFSKAGWKEALKARGALWTPRAKALLAQAGRKGGYTMALAAAAAWGYNYLTDNPEAIKPITKTASKIGNGTKDLAVNGVSRAKNLAVGAWNIFRENAIPDMGILYGSPWFEEGAQVA